MSGKRCEKEVKARVVSLCESPEKTEEEVCLNQGTPELLLLLDPSGSLVFLRDCAQQETRTGTWIVSGVARVTVGGPSQMASRETERNNLNIDLNLIYLII